jgi:hypothetical protein
MSAVLYRCSSVPHPWQNLFGISSVFSVSSVVQFSSNSPAVRLSPAMSENNVIKSNILVVDDER